MYFWEIVLLAVGLSMDSLAVSTASGVVLRNYRPCCIFRIASVMALFQAGMTFLGILFGSSFSRYICDYDHWIAFVLLAYLGGRMIYNGYFRKDGDEKAFNPMNIRTLCGLALATSIDALAIGVSLALLSSAVLLPVAVIGLVTFVFSASGVYFGHRFGGKNRLNLDVLGGIILLGIGCKILVEHLSAG